jgi:hypothetical protein
MIADLQDSESRLKGFLPEYGNISQPEHNQKVQDLKSEKHTAEVNTWVTMFDLPVMCYVITINKLVFPSLFTSLHVVLTERFVRN